MSTVKFTFMLKKMVAKQNTNVAYGRDFLRLRLSQTPLITRMCTFTGAEHGYKQFKTHFDQESLPQVHVIHI